MKKLTVEEVKKELRETASAEPGDFNGTPGNEDTVVYHLWIEGEHFTAERSMDWYFEEVAKKNPDWDDWGQACVEVEDADDGKFDGVCEELTAMANEWIEEENKREEEED